jgi:hypothetical protein
MKIIAHPDGLRLRFDGTERQIDARVRAWREEIDPFSVWSQRHEDHGWYEGHQPFFYLSLLLLVDPTAWCGAVDGLPTPGVMKAALSAYTQVAEDPDCIETLLRVAPPVFDAQGQWVASRSVIALLVAQKIIAHAHVLWEALSSQVRLSSGAERTVAERELRALEGEELPAWMQRAFHVLLERPDGRYIAIGLLGHLGRIELLGQRRFPGGEWSPEQQAFHRLAEALASASVQVRDVRDMWLAAMAALEEKQRQSKAQRAIVGIPDHRIAEDQGEGARMLRGEGLPLLLGAAVMLGSDPMSSAEVEAFWRWFEELLVGRDPGLSLVQHGSSIVNVPQRFGFLLSRAPDPGALFRATYTKLEPQRRRALFAYRYEDYDHDLGSVLLLRVGINAAANWGGQEPGDPAQARELFWWLYEAARRLWLTARDDLDRKKQELIPVSFAFMTILFPESLGEALRRAVPPIANDAWVLSGAGWCLWRNGVTPERLVALMREAGADIESALRDAHQWGKLTAARSTPSLAGQENHEFPASFDALARALGISVDEEQAAEAPPQTEQARRHSEIARSIPWGDALLRRLDEDGCELRHLEPLDATQAVWSLQAALPTALRERFGLSAEVRVLIVHGQVRGRYLRDVQQEPRDTALVDPDLILVASDQPELRDRLPLLAGPWGQRVPWPPADDYFAPLSDALREYLPAFDLFDYRDPVRGSALVGRRTEVEDLAARLLRGEAVGVIGLRKVGKSSLLRAVAETIDPIGARRGMFESLTVPTPNAEPEALVVSLDIQGVAGRSLTVLVERLCTVFEDRLARAGVATATAANTGELVAQMLPSPGLVRAAKETDKALLRRPDVKLSGLGPIEKLHALLRTALEGTALPVCFILDEYDLLFEGYGSEPGIPGVEQVLALLRAEAQATRRVSLALIGRDPSFLDRPLLGGFTNPLAGWAKPMFLGPLQREGADELLVRLGKRVGLDVGAATLETAWRWTGGHPLLVRQYGSAVFELAHAPPTRPRPVPTDPIHADAVEVFLLRPMVHTICTEVHALLEARYPEALTLVDALSHATTPDAGAIVERHGGTRARALDVLIRFGIVAGESSELWVPGVFREWFAPFVPESHIPSRSASGEA